MDIMPAGFKHDGDLRVHVELRTPSKFNNRYRYLS